MDAIELIPNTPNMDIKLIQVKEGETEYKCQIQIIKHFLQITLYFQDILKFEGNISLPKIQNQIITFEEYDINEIFEEINSLNSDDFKLEKKSNKFQLRIEFNILKRKKYLLINLNENENIEKNDLLKNISELKEIIKTKDEIIKTNNEKIKTLEDELKKYK